DAVQIAQGTVHMRSGSFDVQIRVMFSPACQAQWTFVDVGGGCWNPGDPTIIGITWGWCVQGVRTYRPAQGQYPAKFADASAFDVTGARSFMVGALDAQAYSYGCVYDLATPGQSEASTQVTCGNVGPV